MNSLFSGLEPVVVWAHFATLCRIPRASGNEAALREHLRGWAEGRGLTALVDPVGNLIIRKPASPGKEAAPGTILQAHLDMVCQKNEGKTHDFSRDPIRPVLRDGWLLAEGTTLGADNGIGVALILAALEDEGLVHGPLEALLTVVEEAGMDGARGLPAGVLKGRRLINLDTEEWGELYVGCAGGMDVNVSRPGTPRPLPEGWVARRVALTGLKGGHSGVNIHEERGNAIKLLVRVLSSLTGLFPWHLAELHGGTARNALPREAFATLVMPTGELPQLERHLADWQTLLRDELTGVDEELTLTSLPGRADSVMAETEQAVWLSSLSCAPHGVKRMSRRIPGVVETSNNLGMATLRPERGACNFMVRSLLDSGAENLADEIVALFSLSGTTAEKSGHYPGWTPDPASPLLALGLEVYRREFAAQAKVQVIHAGLECGIIAGTYPELDMLSFGPTIQGAHAPGESVHVAAVAQSWQLLKALLAALAP